MVRGQGPWVHGGKGEGWPGDKVLKVDDPRSSPTFQSYQLLLSKTSLNCANSALNLKAVLS